MFKREATEGSLLFYALTKKLKIIEGQIVSTFLSI